MCVVTLVRVWIRASQGFAAYSAKSRGFACYRHANDSCFNFTSSAQTKPTDWRPGQLQSNLNQLNQRHNLNNGQGAARRRLITIRQFVQLQFKRNMVCWSQSFVPSIVVCIGIFGFDQNHSIILCEWAFRMIRLAAIIHNPLYTNAIQYNCVNRELI